MSEASGTVGVDASGLRERLPQQPHAPQKAENVKTAQDAVRQLNEQEAGKDEKDKRTYGRTPDGTGEYLVYSQPAGPLALVSNIFCSEHIANRQRSDEHMFVPSARC